MAVTVESEYSTGGPPYLTNGSSNGGRQLMAPIPNIVRIELIITLVRVNIFRFSLLMEFMFSVKV